MTAKRKFSTASGSSRSRRISRHRIVAPSVTRVSERDERRAERRLVIIPNAGLEAANAPHAATVLAPAVAVSLTASRAVRGLSTLLSKAKASIEPLFTETQLMPPFPGVMSEVRTASANVAAPGVALGVNFDVNAAPPADLGIYQLVSAPDEQLEDLAADLIAHRLVSAAYIDPTPSLPGTLPRRAVRPWVRSSKRAAATAPGAATPDFSALQGYLRASPAGVDAVWAQAQPGGRGDGVSIVDIEGGWCLDHEDLVSARVGLVGGVSQPEAYWRHHGTAVVSELVGGDNGIGVTGIVPNARVSVRSHTPGGAARAILAAGKLLQPGDIMLLEMHQPGPRFDFANRSDQRGFISVEWWPANFAAISYAVSRGIIVVGAAGNGEEDLDDPLYSIAPRTAPNDFGPDWVNPFDRTRRDSGSIFVGAGAPAGGDFGLERSRLKFSNYGALIDAQGWGTGVTACGYGDLQGGSEQRFYTANFGGTSSASPIVVGALAAVQGIRRARGKPPLTPAQARFLLQSCGAAQQGTSASPLTQRIGNLPDIGAMVAAMS